MSQIKHVRMTTISNVGETKVNNISESEACEVRNNALMRKGHVIVKGIENGCSIQDNSGQTLLVAIFEPDSE